MKCTTRWINWSREWGSIAHGIAVVGLIGLAVLGINLESSCGWISQPAVVIAWGVDRGRRGGVGMRFVWRAGWAYLRRSWWLAGVRSEALLLLAVLSGQREWEWVSLIPWGIWLWRGLGASCPWLWRQGWYRGVMRLGEEGSRLALLGLGLGWLAGQVRLGGHESHLAGLGLGGVVVGPEITVEQDEEGWYHVQFKSGEQVVELHLDGRVEFYKRMLIIFLGLLEVPGEARGSRRTRDGRRPLIRQQQLEAWFGERQPNISRWLGYWLKQDWRRLLSLYAPEVLTLELQQRIIGIWAKYPWWGAQQVWEHLKGLGENITQSQVEQAGRESGWSVVREALERVYVIRVESFRVQDNWLVSQLLAQVQGLLEQLEARGGLSREQRIEVKDLLSLGDALGLKPAVQRAPLPWVLHLEHVLFGYWELVEDGSVKCIYCGGAEVSRKSCQARLKKYVDSQGQVQTVEVYRFYCHNPACPYQTFTNLPPDLLPYSPWSMEWRVAALQSYEWMQSVYRRTGLILKVDKMTAYRWVSDFGYELLPVAALFGLVRSSGVVGVDEKYVLVPKNDKPESKMKRWMYVYFAVDCYTYDLLHIAIYPYNNHHSATAFLLALRAKGYHPRVIVTDLRVDYGPLIARIFSQAIHHECIFHALQQVHKDLKEAYGRNYAEIHPEVELLRQAIDAIFATRSKRTAQDRYQAVLAQRAHFSAASSAFDLLEAHWPKLVNAIESSLIPTTNNATEEVIRIFTQHYKTFCGFESIQSAQTYLAVFEKVYRFSPFSDDAQERIRGKCPLEVAGYDVSNLPIAQLFRGFALQWPAKAFQEVIPSV
jgi:transposase-like protein